VADRAQVVVVAGRPRWMRREDAAADRGAARVGRAGIAVVARHRREDTVPGVRVAPVNRAGIAVVAAHRLAARVRHPGPATVHEAAPGRQRPPPLTGSGVETGDILLSVAVEVPRQHRAPGHEWTPARP